ncbi:MAG: rubrerythrin family protein [Alphaproteobacteria bacterium]|nr:rubrerythrin family protein [Alphaproteobacteria bacterium]
MKTPKNLTDAFLGESMTSRKYLAFGLAALGDELPQVAKLFRAVAAAEDVHALAHLRAMGGVKTTAENLAVAIAGEKYAIEERYPGFLAIALAEGHHPAAVSMGNAMAAENVHHSLFTEALGAVESGRDLPSARIHVCNVCGNTVIGDVPGLCLVCKAEKFTEIA